MLRSCSISAIVGSAALFDKAKAKSQRQHTFRTSSEAESSDLRLFLDQETYLFGYQPHSQPCGLESKGSLYQMQAIERGEGSGENWEEFDQRLAQAAADTETFGAALQQAVKAREVSFCASVS